MTDLHLDWVARDTVDDVIGSCAPHKVCVVTFHPADPAGDHTLYSNAAAEQLVPVLRALLTRLEAGGLRMPPLGGTRWVDDTVAP